MCYIYQVHLDMPLACPGPTLTMIISFKNIILGLSNLLICKEKALNSQQAIGSFAPKMNISLLLLQGLAMFRVLLQSNFGIMCTILRPFATLALVSLFPYFSTFLKKQQ